MKKNIKYVCVLITLTLFMFVSCSGNLTDTLLKVMDSTNTNVFEQAGIVKPDTSAATKVLDALETSNTTVTVSSENKVAIAIGDKEVKITIQDDELKSYVNGGILQPQSAEQKNQLKDNVSEAFNNKAVHDKLEKELGNTVKDDNTISAIKGTFALGSSALTNVADSITDNQSPIKIALNNLAESYATVAKTGKTYTEADKAQAQLLNNIAASATNASSVLLAADKTTKEKMNDPAVKEFIDDTLTLYNVAKIATGSVDIIKEAQIIPTLLGSSISDREINVDGIPENIKKLIPNLISSLLGKDPEKYDSKIRSFTSMVNAKNAAFAIVVDENEEYPVLKSQATNTAILEYITAAIVKQIGNNDVKYENVSILELIRDVVEVSGENFFDNMKEVKSNKYEAEITSLFKDGYSDVLVSLLDSVKYDALVADKMLYVGDSSINALFDLLKLDIKTEQKNISGLIEYYKGEVKK